MTPYYQHAHLDLHLGHVLDVLADLPADSVDCCVTSPPYLGLRSYGTEPQVWLDGQAACEGHDWGHNIAKPGNTYRRDHGTVCDGGRATFGDIAAINSATGGQFCCRCNAWRGELGLEPTPDLFIAHLVEVFRAVKRVLKPTGTLWLNMGDSYNGSGGAGGDYAPGGLKDGQPKYPGRHVSGLKPKDLMMMPARVALALQAEGWWLRSEIVWAKPNPMPESVTDRPTRSHEMIYLFSKRANYYYDAEAVREDAIKGGTGGGRLNHAPFDPRMKTAVNGRFGERGNEPMEAGRNMRSVWQFATAPYPEAHFATFPPELPRRCIAAGSSEHGVCPACGKPWTRVVEPSEDYKQHLGQDWGDDKKDEAEGRGHFKLPDGSRANQRSTKRNGPRLTADYKTTGWSPTCRCNRPDVVPAVVLDPFSGSGTTGLVANQMGRRAILIELKRAYADMAIQRLQQEVLL